MPSSWRGDQTVKFLRKSVYFVVGLVVLPGCAAVAYSTIAQVARSGDFQNSIVFFFIGFASYLIFFLTFRKPLGPYLLGHELTHALWVMLFRGRVQEIRLSRQRGQIKATKTNTLIALAPYFFPLYTVLLIAAYCVACMWIDLGNYRRLVIFAIGFTWSFHLLLNVFVLCRGQEDLKMSGSFFSLVAILTLNVIVFGLITAFISEKIALKDYISTLTCEVVRFYSAVVRAIGPG